MLLAGNGHVRRDIGVPRWLNTLPASRWLAVGYVESDHADAVRGLFDAVVVTAPASRADPCKNFKAPLPSA